MNDLLQKHGCANVFTVPEGLKELMADISREVLRDQPPKIFDYIANYLSVLLITREHGILAVRILDDLCDCRPSVSEHLMEIGMERPQAADLAEIIKEEVEGYQPEEGKERLKEMQILKRILAKVVLDEETTAKVCQIVRNAYRDYWYRKKLLEKKIKVHPEEPWEIAAERTLMLYKSTKPSYTELNRATEKIQAAYRGYHVRRNILKHLKPKSKKKQGPKVELPGPPADVANSREIDLGVILDTQVRVENVESMFEDAMGNKLGLPYDPMKTLTHQETPREPDVPLGDVNDAKFTRFQSSPELKTKDVASKTDAARKLSARSMTNKPLSPLDGDGAKLEERKSVLSMAGPRRSTALGGSQQKITFAEAPADLIDDDIPEEITIQGTDGTDEVPEDITGISDVESAPPSSAPDTDISAPEDEEEEE